MNAKRRFIIPAAVIILILLAFFVISCLKEDNKAVHPAFTAISEGQDAAEPAVTDAAKYSASAELDNISKGIISAGDSFLINMTGLNVTVNSVKLSSNLYSAGWSMADIYPETMVILDGADSGGVNYLKDNIDSESGKLADGLTLVTVNVTVKNMNTGNTAFGPQENCFGNDVLYLVTAKDVGTELYGHVEFPAYKSAACSCERAIPGQYAWMQLLPGEERSYDLAYVADDYVTVDGGYIASYNLPVEGACFFPLTAAERLD